jgi:hypothetical protein
MPDPTPTELIRHLDEKKFIILAHDSPKAVRETIFARLGIKPKATPKTRFAKPGAKTEEQLHALHEALQEVDDNEVAEELLRNYFLKRRALLGAALDYLKIPHEDGLTNAELDAFAKLTPTEGKKLLESLAKDHDRGDAELYLRFMKTPIA